MRRSLVTLILTSLTIFPGAVAWAQEDTGPPEWARDLKLSFFGGPALVDLEVLLNGEIVAVVNDTVPRDIEIASLVRSGTNELTLRFAPPEAPREEVARLRISVASVRRLENRVQVDRVFVETSIPPDFEVEEACEAVRRFTAEPRSAPRDPLLKKRFWLTVEGPTVQHNVQVVINGALITDVYEGGQVLEVTSHLRRGRNTVVFEGVPRCVQEETSRQDPLILSIGPAPEEMDRVKTIENPVATYQVDNRRRPTPFIKKLVFKAW